MVLETVVFTFVVCCFFDTTIIL